MSHKAQWTTEDMREIERSLKMIAQALGQVDMPIAASALMIMAANVASKSNNTDEYIIDQFRKVLFDVRTRGLEKSLAQ